MMNVKNHKVILHCIIGIRHDHFHFPSGQRVYILTNSKKTIGREEINYTSKKIPKNNFLNKKCFVYDDLP